MFAAAAVAAAAALTAITTTSAVGLTEQHHLLQYSNQATTSNSQQQSIDQQQKSRPHISWHQYAMQRRNSLQRRKFEIDRRIKQASAANNKTNLHLNELKQFQSNSSKQQKQTDLSVKKNSVVQSLDMNENPPLTYRYSLENPLDQLDMIKSIAGGHQNFDYDSTQLLKGLNSDMCNEFIRLHNIQNQDAILNGTQIEMTDISQALFEYLQENNLIDENQTFNELNSNLNQVNNNQYSLDYKKASKLAGVHAKRPNRRSKQKYDSLKYRWNPRWLRMLRKTTCLPVAIVTLFLLIFTNLSSNWIYIEENQRAGLWAICKSKTDLSSPPTLKYSNEINNDKTNSNSNNNNNNNNSKLKKPRPLFDKPKKFEECYAKFLLKDDTHLVVLALVLVGFFFHLIGLVFLIIGLFISPTNKILYYYHSAGECLLSSSLILAIDLFAFASIVSSQLTPQKQSYKFGYCFYTNLVVSLVTFFYSLLFYLDDFVNEYRIWREKIAEENNRIY